MNLDDLRRRAAVVREVPLEAVLIYRGEIQDRRDRSKWHTEQGSLSVTGPKFMNWQRAHGGGGAIDLVMHLAGVDYRTAVQWLEHHLAVGHLAVDAPVSSSSEQRTFTKRDGTLRLPVRNDRMLGRVRRYLAERRHLSPSLIGPLIQSGRLYADNRANAVFLLVAGKANRPIGAELRGTGPQAWRGMAPGTRKNLGYFWVGRKGSRGIVLCESAIDAISCFQIHPERICISTSGVRTNPQWLPTLLAHGYTIHCGFDADKPGDNAATRMIAFHPKINRLRPPSHDWNDALPSAK
jgi:hypothetical protein